MTEPTPTPPTPQPFSWGTCIGTFVVTLIGGMILNVAAGFVSMALSNQPLGGLIGAAPGVIFIFVASRSQRTGFAQGMLAAACLVALVGGLCGYGLGAGLDFK